MEFKNLSNFRLKWFGTDEIRNLEEVREKLPFITGFSFGPFAPYNLYHFFHNIWDYFILEMIIVGAVTYISLISFYIFFFATTIKSMFQQNNESITDYSSSSMSHFFKIFSPSYFLWLIIILMSIVISVVSVKFFAGKHSRKLSWNRCEWKSFEAFEQGEKNWHIVGLVFFFLYMLNILVSLGLIIGGYFLLKGIV